MLAAVGHKPTGGFLMVRDTLHHIAEELDLTLEPWQWDIFNRWLAVWPVDPRVLPDPAMTGLAVIDPGRPQRDA